jgi:hypothetical protein
MSDDQSVSISENSEKSERSESPEKDLETKEKESNKSKDYDFPILKKYTFQAYNRNNSKNNILKRSSFKFRNINNDNHIKKKCSFKIDNINNLFKKEHILKIEDDYSDDNESKNDSINESKQDNDSESESKHNNGSKHDNESKNDNESMDDNESMHDNNIDNDNDNDNDNCIKKKCRFKYKKSDNNINNNHIEKKLSFKSIKSNGSNDNFILRKSSFKRNNTQITKKFIKFNLENTNLGYASSSKENNIKINDKKKDNNIRKVKSNKSKYNINNFINNEININIIDNNYLNQTLKNSFIKNNLLNEYYIDDHNLQMSYQEEPNKSRSKSISTLMEKYNSDRLRSIKEKYLNNDMNYSNSINKISLDEKKEELLSDKDSEINYSNNNESNDIFIITAPGKRRKKNTKASTGITPIKHEIFVKILLSILGKDNRDSSSQIKEDSSRELNHIDKNGEDFIDKDNQIINNIKKIPFKSLKSFNEKSKNIKVNIPKKRSSLISSLKINYKNINHNKHVTFTKNSCGNIKKYNKDD